MADREQYIESILIKLTDRVDEITSVMVAEQVFSDIEDELEHLMRIGDITNIEYSYLATELGV